MQPGTREAIRCLVKCDSTCTDDERNMVLIAINRKREQGAILTCTPTAQPPKPVNLLSENQAAEILSCSRGFLTMWRNGLRRQGEGFPFNVFKIASGQVRYVREEVMEYVDSLRKVKVNVARRPAIQQIQQQA